MPRQRNQSITKTHYKAYKAGKRWLFAAISTAAFASAVGFSNPHVTFADNLSEPTSQTGESPTSDSTASGATADPSDLTDSVADETTDATSESDEATTSSTPAPDSTSDSNTQALSESSKKLDTEVEAAKAKHVSVTETAPTVTQATPENLSEQTASVVATNQDTQVTIADASNVQDANNEAYQTAKTDYDKQTVTIASTNDEWTNAEIIHLLADEGGESDVSEATEITDKQRLAASDQVKRAASVTFNKGATVTNVDGTPLANMSLPIRPDAMPAWKYNNAFTDPATGRSINVVETITDYKVAANANEKKDFQDNGNYVVITDNQIGFTPHFVENITADVSYFYADTGEAATLDVILGFADMDGHQGITLNNGFATLIKGSDIGYVDGIYRDTKSVGNMAPSDPVTQIWVLQRGVNHTSYTFYVGFKADGIGVDNFEPIQYIGGAAFSTKLPTPPTLKSESVSYSPNQVVVTTQATIQYTGADDATPKSEVVPITYTGNFNTDTQTWTWHPDTDAIEITAPILEGYTLDPSADTLALQPLTVDPTDQTYVLHYSQNPLLTVHYLDEAGNQVKSDITKTGAIGANYSVSAPSRIGNFALNDPQPQTGQYIPGDQSLTFTYSPAKTLLTTHYVDENNHQLQADTTQTGNSGDPFTLDAPPIDGYTLLGKNVSTGVYTGETMEITFHYVQIGKVGENQATGLTVHYVDQDGNKIDQDDTQSGDMDTDFKVTAKHIPNYTIIGKTEHTGKLVGNTMDITFTYAKRGTVGNHSKSDLTVHYVDQDGNKITEDDTQSGDMDTDFKVTAKRIPDYTIIGKTEYTGKFVGNAMDITFTYAKRGTVGNHLKTDLTVHYVDQDGNQIDEDAEHSGPLGTNFKVTAKHIPDYTIIGKTEYAGKFVGNTMDITFTYAKRGTVGNNLKTDLTVHYVDQDGNKIDQDDTQSGDMDTDFDVTAKHIPNYTIIGKTKYTGKFVGNAMDITFVYAKRGTVGKDLKTDLTVHYVDQDGNQIDQDAEHSGPLGTNFKVTAKHISDYTSIGKTDYAGNFVGNAMDITFVYAKRGTVGKNRKTDLTVHYVDQDGNQINEDAEHSGPLGTNFKVTAKHISDYTSIGKTDYAGNFVGNAMDITFTYAKRGIVGNHLKTDLTVHYVDQDDNIIAEETKQPGEIGDTFDVIAKQIPGYTIIGKAEYADKYVGNTMDLTFTYAKRGVVGDHLKTDLTVHYVDQDGNVIAEDSKQSGEIDSDFDITAKQIPGFTIIGKAEYADKYIGNTMDLTFTYAKRGVVGDHLKTDLTVHYVDQNDNVIAEDSKQPGEIDDAFDVIAKQIPGYTVIGKAEYSGKYDGNLMDLTFTYAKRGSVGNHLKTDLTVHYVDQEGNVIAEDTKQSGTMDASFDITGKHISGYTILGKAEYIGKYIGNTMDITFTYAKRGAVGNHLMTDLTVQYVDQDGNTIADDSKQSGKIDTDFDVNAKQIPGYTVIGKAEYAGKYVGNTMDITFTYAKRGTVGNHLKTDLTVHYVDQDGNAIAEDTTQSGDIDSVFEVQAKQIPNYTIIGTSEYAGKYVGNTMDITFTYAKRGVVGNHHKTDLIVHYVDQDGNPIAPDAVQSGTIGTAFNLDAAEIPGYTITSPSTATGTYQGNTMAYTFAYRQASQLANTKQTQLIKRFVNEKGETIRPDISLYGPTGYTYLTMAQPIAGYTLLGKYAQTGTYQGDVMTLTFVYRQIINDSGTPDTNVTPGVNDPDLEVTPSDETTPTSNPNPTIDANPGTETVPDIPTQPTNETVPTPDTQPNDVTHPVIEPTPTVDSKPTDESTPITDPNPTIKTTPATEIEPHHIDNPEVNLNPVTESKPNHDTLPATNADDPETPDLNPSSAHLDHGKASTDTPIPQSPDTLAQPTRSTLPNTDVTSAPQPTSVTPTNQPMAQTGIQTTATRSAKTLPETGDAKQSLFLLAGMSLMTLFATGLAATRKRHHAD